MVRQGTYWEPLFSIVPTALGVQVEHAWQNGERSPRGAFLPLGAQPLLLEMGDIRLSNLNDEQSLLSLSSEPADK
jgi:molybdopterin-guanine dinucleotide biosynthesis protein A